jgi:hypothetical protein
VLGAVAPGTVLPSPLLKLVIMNVTSVARRVGMVALASSVWLATSALGQPAQPRAAAPPTPRQAAPHDLTGYWVSVVSEDWRWRMITPPPGDYSSVPLNAAGREAADAWDRDADIRNGNECRPYGAGGIMRVPGRIRINWDDDDTLKVESDAGTQTRLFHFGAFQSSTSPTWQGDSVASWEMVGARRGQPPTGGSLEVVTRGMRPGYVRWNGVPYSEEAVITEHFDRNEAFGDVWLTVTTIVEDPKYYNQPFIVSSDFKREPNGAKWQPTPCVTDPPLRGKPPAIGG